ncbi:MAG: glycosyltransferase family 2 protein [Chloroflexi bacterium]|nr:glycosyltransferase family 2 protein [Chloroflexota bacterium]
MSEHPPPVSVVVVTYNSETTIAACLRSVAAAGGAAEIVVVDNASHDRSIAVSRDVSPGVRVIANSGNEGFARAANQGIRASGSPWVLLLNPDAELTPGALTALLEFAERHPRAGIVGPRVLNADGTLQHSCFKAPSFRMALYGFFPVVPMDSVQNGRYSLADYGRPSAVEHLLGAWLLVRRAAAEAVGLLDERFWMYFEETDWCWRMRQVGWEVLYTPDAAVTHISAHSSSREPERMTVAFARSQARYYRKRFGLPGYLLLKAIVLPGVCWWLARTLRARIRGRVDDATLQRRLWSYWRVLLA